MDLAAAFVLGLFGSLHCAGMCGPLALALPQAGGGAGNLLASRAMYNLGRVITYTVLGLLFGFAGQTFALAGLQRWVSIALGLALILGLFVSKKARLLGLATRAITPLKESMGALLRRPTLPSVMLLGLLNGLLPCGLVYVAVAGATATGSVVAGGQYMAVFGLGTVPMMLAISLSGTLVPVQLRLKLTRFIPLSVFVLGALLVLRGMSLGIPILSPDITAGSCCHR